MRSAELLVWLGDFNYRIGCTYTEAKERIRNNQLDYLLEQVSLAMHYRTLSILGSTMGKFLSRYHVSGVWD